MRLKRLELYGFKSFADRTVLEFDDTLTGIVGPNGCGKSNVVDAIRWVLGERRPTSMRGAEMTDVIFKGSTSRPALGVAEVTMTLDNEGGADDAFAIEGRGSEVSITRRVFQGGEGEYLLDGDRVRLKDVREMLFDTGLGSRGYAVLEQGRIDAVLSADALERRTIFEEAAGISRYRQRRREAESRLGRVQRDLERIDDVLGELRTRSRSLKIQAGRAQRFVEVRDSWRDQATRLAVLQVRAADAELADLGEALRAEEAREQEQRTARTRAEEEAEGRGRERTALAAEVDRLGEHENELAGDLRALDERRHQLESRISAWRDGGESEDARAAVLERRLDERRKEHGDLCRQADELREGVEEVETRVGAATRALRTSVAAAREARRECEEQNENVLAILHERTGEQNAVQHMERSLSSLGERAVRTEERRSAAARSLEAGRAAAARAQESLAAAGAEISAGESRRNALSAESEDVELRLAEVRQERRELELERERAASRMQSLRDRESEQEGIWAGARALLDAQDAAAGDVSAEGGGTGAADPRLPVELAGLLADHLRTETRYARALDAALGETARALVVDDLDAASAALSWLEERRAGLARFVAPAGFGSGTVPPGLPSDLGVRTGGPLRAVVEVDPGFGPLADRLLAGVVLVQTVAQAREVCASHPELRCVTPSGDLLGGGVLSGGWREVAHGPVGRRASAAELEGALVDLDARIARVVASEEELERERSRLVVVLADAEGELLGRRDALAEARGAGDTARARLTDLEETAVVLAADDASAREELERTAAELDAARVRLSQASTRFEEDNAGLQRAEEGRAALEARHEELAREESASRVAWTGAREKLDGLERRATDLERVLSEGAAEVERAKGLSAEQCDRVVRGQADLEELAEHRIELLDSRAALNERLTEARAADRAGREALEVLRRRAEQATRELEAEMSALAERRLQVQRVQLSRDEVVRRAQEDLSLAEHELTDPGALETDDGEDQGTSAALEQLAVSVADLRSQLDKLGPVNVEALDELEEVSGRLTFLETQRGDLESSRRSLESTLRKIDEESERLFLETFEEVRSNFQASFRRLFGGGRADVTLEEGVSALDAGILIVARAPGREMLPIGLLSGGQRTLCALALLFAIFQARPSPFCILDEVDAALDDANIGRFLTLLDGFRKHTQFVVVTHNKGTMGACDSLYGITMQVKGVSTQVSVEIDEVDEFVPEAAGVSEPVVEITPATRPIDSDREAAVEANIST